MVLERVLNMISRNAYIITGKSVVYVSGTINWVILALYGYPFYKAGKKAFKHLVANVLRVAAINSVGDFVLFLAKVLVVACCVAIAVFFLKVHFDNVKLT